MKIMFKLCYALAIITAFAACSSDDPKVILPQLSIEDEKGAEGSSITFYVQINTESKDTVYFSYKTTDGTATSADYTAITAGKGKIIPGMLETAITVITKKDALTTETDETFKITLSDAKGADILVGEATGTITNVTSSTPPPASSDYSMKVKIDGSQWSANVSANALLPSQYNSMTKTIVGYGTDANSQLTITFSATPTVKTYAVGAISSASDVSAIYSPNFFSGGINMQLWNGQPAGGEVKITSFNTTTKIIEGTFKMTVKDSKSTNTKALTEGSFKLPID